MEKELGLYQGALRHWREEVKADPANAFPGTGHLKPYEEENRRLLRENAILREERDILKKAAAIFLPRPKTFSGS
jgi:transposase